MREEMTMSEKQPEALRLADALDIAHYEDGDIELDAAALLRTQHADIERKDALLRQALEAMNEAQTYTSEAAWSPSMTDELKTLCLAITKELQ